MNNKINNNNFTFILGIVTVGDCNLTFNKHPEEFARSLLVTGIMTFPIGLATKSHRNPSITMNINLVIIGLYSACLFMLKIAYAKICIFLNYNALIYIYNFNIYYRNKSVNNI